MSKTKKGIVLLSGGLDSVVSLAVLDKEIDFKLALTFNYGQKSFKNEALASKRIADFYKIEHKIIELDWLKNITNTKLVADGEVPQIGTGCLDDKVLTQESCKNVWVPNRNGLFINIAACYADSFGYDKIVIGANKEEAATFSDNSKEFIQNINLSLKKSTMNKVEVTAPLIDFEKREIIQKGLENNAPLELINSCYVGGEKHCGTCESCSRLKRALQNENCFDLIKKLF